MATIVSPWGVPVDILDPMSARGPGNNVLSPRGGDATVDLGLSTAPTVRGTAGRGPGTKLAVGEDAEMVAEFETGPRDTEVGTSNVCFSPCLEMGLLPILSGCLGRRLAPRRVLWFFSARRLVYMRMSFFRSDPFCG